MPSLRRTIYSVVEKKAPGNYLLRKVYFFTYYLLLRNKSLRFPMFRWFLLFRFAIILALNMQSTIMQYFAYKLTYNPLTGKGDTLVLGMIGLWEVIPAIGFSLFSGHFVDLKEKRGMVLKCTIGYLLVSVFFVALALPRLQQSAGTQMVIWLLYAGVFAGGALRAFLSPASFALYGMLLPRKLYANATTWSSTAWQAGFVIGPLLAGFMISVTGFQWSIAASGGFQLVALAALVVIPAQAILKKEKEPILKSLGEGIRFVFSTQLILAALSLDMFAVLFGGAVALLPVFADEILNIGEVGFGWMRAAPGIGSILMLMILSVMPLKKNPGVKLLLSIVGFGVSTIIFGWSAHIAPTVIMGSFLGCNLSWAFLLAFFMLLLGGMFDSISVVIRSTVLQLYTPDKMRGRVAAVNTMFISSSNELGAMESGMTARWMGAAPAVVFGGFMTLIVVVITYFAAPMLRVLTLEAPAEDKNKAKE